MSWIKRFVRSSGLRHPGELGERDVARFLTHLAVEHGVAPSTQMQALAALLFLYETVLERPLGRHQGREAAGHGITRGARRAVAGPS